MIRYTPGGSIETRSGTYRGVLVPDEAITSDQDRRVVYVVSDDGSVSARWTVQRAMERASGWGFSGMPDRVEPGPKETS